jgi:hypothetical protein
MPAPVSREEICEKIVGGILSQSHGSETILSLIYNKHFVCYRQEKSWRGVVVGFYFRR